MTATLELETLDYEATLWRVLSHVIGSLSRDGDVMRWRRRARLYWAEPTFQPWQNLDGETLKRLMSLMGSPSYAGAPNGGMY